MPHGTSCKSSSSAIRSASQSVAMELESASQSALGSSAGAACTSCLPAQNGTRGNIRGVGVGPGELVAGDLRPEEALAGSQARAASVYSPLRRVFIRDRARGKENSLERPAPDGLPRWARVGDRDAVSDNQEADEIRGLYLIWISNRRITSLLTRSRTRYTDTAVYMYCRT